MDTVAAEAGLAPEGMAQIAPSLQAVVDAGDLAGLVTLVWRKGEIAQLNTLGKRNIESGAPMEADTIFRIASMTKPITSVAALMLLEEGKLKLDDPITKWAPEFADMQVIADPAGPLEATAPAPRDITIEDLLTHRAGLAYGFTSVGPLHEAHEKALGPVLAAPLPPDEWMTRLGNLPLTYPPGDRMHYSHATDVLGFVLGRIAGKPFRELLIERLFEPLGMEDTDFYVPPAKQARAATVYQQDQETGALKPVPFAKADSPPEHCSGGGGLLSTAPDYLKFARMLLNGGELDGRRYLKPETVAMMTANRLTDAQRQHTFLGMPFWMGQGFGLGVSTITDPDKHEWMGAGSAGSFGWPGAFGTWWQADPAEEMILIFLIQNYTPLTPDMAGQAVTARMGARVACPMFQKMVYGALGG